MVSDKADVIRQVAVQSCLPSLLISPIFSLNWEIGSLNKSGRYGSGVKVLEEV
jgi:hypothetical protein